MNDQMGVFSERLENCPPHLRGRLMRQQTRMMAMQSPSAQPLHEVIQTIVSRFGPLPENPKPPPHHLGSFTTEGVGCLGR